MADMADRADRADMADRAGKSEIMNDPLTGPQHQLLEDAIASKNLDYNCFDVDIESIFSDFCSRVQCRRSFWKFTTNSLDCSR